MQKIWILLRWCIICQSRVAIILWHQEVWGIIRDDENDNANEIDAVDNSTENKKKTTTSRSFEYKTNITRSATADDNILGTKVVIPLNTRVTFGDLLIWFWLTVKQSLIWHGQEIWCYHKYIALLKYLLIQVYKQKQPKNNNLDHMIDPTFRNIKFCFLLHSKMVPIIIQEFLLIGITCH